MGRWRACRERWDAGQRLDAGIGLVLVLGYAVVIGLIVSVSIASASSVLRSSRAHVQYGQAIDNAEAGVDQTLARLSKASSYNPGNVLVPTQWANGFPDSTTERTWVLNTANTVLTADPALLQQTAQGEFLGLRPGNVKTIYSVGWEPSRANPLRVRVLRNDYAFSGFSPRTAVLTNGDVAMPGSFTLSSNAGTALLPDIHSEGRITSCVPSNSMPTGTTISGVGGGGGCSPASSSQTVPQLDPRSMYTTLSPGYASQWYDLCPDGTVRSTGTTPCTGTVAAGTRNWTFSPSNATWSSVAPQSGIYYVYHGNVDITSVSGDLNSAPTNTVTIFTEASPGCARTDGNVHVIKNKLAPALPFVSIYAGGTVKLDAQHSVGTTGNPGLVGAQQDLTFLTSSAPGVVGAAVANNLCGGSNILQGAEVRFDANMTIRGSDVIRSTLQTELN